MPPGAGARNAKVGIDTAADELGVPRLIAPEDLASPDIDDLRFVCVFVWMSDPTVVLSVRRACTRCCECMHDYSFCFE